jgi:palmitoyl-protein thioesterase
MMQITADTGSHIGSYSTCIPTGDNVFSDTINGFLMTMDNSVDVFASKIRADAKLAGGFNAIGFSQGNSLIRGYIQKYNDPPVYNALHVHGTIAGVGACPQCNPSGNGICQGIAELLGSLAYNGLVQAILFQANYFRDPTKSTSPAYQQYSELAQWNGEGSSAANSTYKANFALTKKFVMVKALQDSMVFPNEAEWWGSFGSDFNTVLTMQETPWYKEDTFG